MIGVRSYPEPRLAEPMPAERLPVWDGATAPWPGQFADLPSGGRLHVRRTPPAATGLAGRRFVFVHGLGGSATNWTDLAGLLAALGEGAAIDLPGFGRSPAPPRRGWSHAERIAVVIEAIEAIEGLEGLEGLEGSEASVHGAGLPAQGGEPRPVHLVGNSMGGAVALAVAAVRPDLVQSLTLISPAMPDLRIVRQLRRSPMPLMLLPGVGRLVEREMARMTPQERVAATIALCVGDPLRLSAARIEAAEIEAAEQMAAEGTIRGETASLRALVRAQLRFGDRSMWAVARRVRAPTLVVWGGRDRLTNVDRAPRLCAELPNARLLLLPDAGHVAMIEQPVQVASAVAALVERAESHRRTSAASV